MREIGGYIECEHYHGEMLYSDAIRLNNGRNCLAYLLHAKKINKLFIPFFMCDCISDVCKQYGVEVVYYHIDKNFLPINVLLKNDEWILIVNYYGQLTDEQIVSCKKKYERMILDNTQAYFAERIRGVDTFYSCRKYFGVSDGGLLYTDKEIEVNERDVSYDRMNFLFGRFEKSASEFYSMFEKNENYIDGQTLKKMSYVTENLLRGIEYAKVKKIRTANFTYLHDKLGSINKLELFIPQGAFMYPLLIDNAPEIRKCLIEKKIYIPRLWPNVVESVKKEWIEYSFAMNILPIPCDQRYTIEDMEYIYRTIIEIRDMGNEL